MRITGGTLSGRKLSVPKLPDVRPTTERARESLLNWLSNRIDFSTCSITELFAGTGVVSFEMISRGCPKAICVDIQSVCCQTISSIAQKWNLPVEVVCADAFHFIEHAQPVGLVFADPPYRLPLLHTLPQKIMSSALLTNGGILILEHDQTYNFGDLIGYKESRRYGEGVFSIFEVLST
ncbi:MAG: 16S rRNA (guanine(966)-N(2))-methyltransferase RsmD [Sphingomonadales bacterium]|nr:16S rRNA (guanine(966)-N(2))-methyltransferase RsmD [Sphingomonadales bacterium]